MTVHTWQLGSLLILQLRRKKAGSKQERGSNRSIDRLIIKLIMLLSLTGSCRIRGAPGFGCNAQLQQQQQRDADAVQLSGSRRVVAARREQAQEIRSPMSSCWISPPQGQRTLAQLPLLHTSSKRSSRGETRHKRVPRRKDVDVVLCALSVRDLVLSGNQHVVQEPPLYRRFVDYAVQQCSQHMLLEPFPMKVIYRLSRSVSRSDRLPEHLICAPSTSPVPSPRTTTHNAHAHADTGPQALVFQIWSHRAVDHSV